jgi:hypothetical protein
MNFYEWYYAEALASASRKYTHDDYHKSFLPRGLIGGITSRVKYFPRWAVEKLIEIEKSAHLPHMHMHDVIEDEIKNDPDVIDKITEKMVKDIYGCDGKAVYLITDNFYIIGCETGKEVEIGDFAAMGGKIEDMKSAAQFLGFIRQFKGKRIKADMREDTSYALLKAQKESGRVKIHHDEVWDWSGTPMHEIEFEIL